MAFYCDEIMDNACWQTPESCGYKRNIFSCNVVVCDCEQCNEKCDIKSCLNVEVPNANFVSWNEVSLPNYYEDDRSAEEVEGNLLGAVMQKKDKNKPASFSGHQNNVSTVGGTTNPQSPTPS
ncbi:unnamed protein product [Moneuplotes crassus]|uniref:Uncharacterized protein n=1 Tax=Euplotes crassus TaxID=5936 RepID=A0AAD2D6D2_EUPCR|nr:unnamed protein product [Moneuplotes crassus]